jgi:hypothetical protein
MVKSALFPCVTGVVFPHPVVAIGVVTMPPCGGGDADPSLLPPHPLRSSMRRIAAIDHLPALRFVMNLISPVLNTRRYYQWYSDLDQV